MGMESFKRIIKCLILSLLLFSCSTITSKDKEYSTDIKEYSDELETINNSAKNCLKKLYPESEMKYSNELALEFDDKGLIREFHFKYIDDLKMNNCIKDDLKALAFNSKEKIVKGLLKLSIQISSQKADSQ